MSREKRRDLGSAPGQDGMDVAFLAGIISRQDHPHPPPPICLFVLASMFPADAFLWLSHGKLSEVPPSSIIKWLDLLWRRCCYFYTSNVMNMITAVVNIMKTIKNVHHGGWGWHWVAWQGILHWAIIIGCGNQTLGWCAWIIIIFLKKKIEIIIVKKLHWAIIIGCGIRLSDDVLQ